MNNSQPTKPLLDDIGLAVRGLMIHDVTPALSPDVAMFFPNPAPQVRPFSTHESHGAAANVWEFHEHSGAHVDAPFHFDPNGPTVDELSPDVLFFRPFKKFDLAALDLQPGQPLELADLKSVALRDGITVRAGDIVVFDFGYDKYLPGGTLERELQWWGRNQPGLAEDTCAHLAEAGVSAVASDTSACDLGVRDGEVSAGTGHGQHFLPRGILIIEGLRGLGKVPSTGLFVALPLKLRAGTASPLRVLLLTD